MTVLETRYRRLLRIYPAGHRADYEEEMVAVLVLTPLAVFAIGVVVLTAVESFAARSAGHLRAHE
ncbi:hypothetical protein [Actinoplanes sp. G11-F43]|uniref:hypothetical protein n=1 Tax=Actinoplanes sp. G11-F43 TaxID=3424130 RepID=UPI003D327FAE